jgi:hypothetical protein
MTIARTITSDTEWDLLPVGTLARVDYMDTDDEGHESIEGTMTILRVEGDFRANAGDYMLAGGKYWAEVWVWQQGITVMDTSTLPGPDYSAPRTSVTDAVAAVDAAITGHTKRVEELKQTPFREYVKLPPEAHPAPTPAQDIVDSLTALGWAPAPVYPEGVQVWTISGIPAEEIRSDGTMAYLSLPEPDRKGADRFAYLDRRDIWLEKPTVTVNFELPARTVNY